MNSKMRDLSDVELQLVGGGFGSFGDPIGSYGDPPSSGKTLRTPPSGLPLPPTATN